MYSPSSKNLPSYRSFDSTTIDGGEFCRDYYSNSSSRKITIEEKICDNKLFFNNFRTNSINHNYIKFNQNVIIIFF